MSLRKLTVLLTMLTFAAVLRAKDLREHEIIVGGGAAQANGYWLSGMNLSLRRGQPGVMFCLVQRPGQTKELAYVLLIKGDEQRRIQAKYGGTCRVVDTTPTDASFVEIGGVRVNVAYRLQAAADAKALAIEELSINGQKLDPKKGRVVLVDLRGPQAKWRQVEHAMPPAPSAPKTIADIDAAAKNWVRRLRQYDRFVDKRSDP